MDTTFQKLKQAWRYKHIKFLTFFLENHHDYYEGSFTYEKGKGGDIIVNDKVLSDDDIVRTLTDYYEDIGDYETPFGDFLYLVFTDMVEEDVDILALLDAEDVA